jgi:branched-chain amino acid aminotransferase
MPFPVIWMNGRITDPRDARVPVFDHGLLYGDGVFEGIRFYAKHAFRMREHLDRLVRSARCIELALPYSAEALWRAAESVVEATGEADGYLRLLVTRGEGDLGLDPRSCKRPTVVIAAAALRFFEGAETNGVKVVVASTRQAPPDVLDARIKSLNYLNRLLARLEAVRVGADEAIMLNREGRIAEGASDNVFLVRDGVLFTPPASDGALEGVTRAVVLELAGALGMAARVESLAAYDLRACDEAFIVGTGAGLFPVRSVDGVALPACPGPVFRRIHEAFLALVARESRPGDGGARLE